MSERHLFYTNSLSFESSVSQSRQEASGPRGVAGSVPSTGHLPSSPEVQWPGPRLSTPLIVVPSLGAPGNFWALSVPSRRLYGAGSSALGRLVPHCQWSPPAFATYWPREDQERGCPLGEIHGEQNRRPLSYTVYPNLSGVSTMS